MSVFFMFSIPTGYLCTYYKNMPIQYIDVSKPVRKISVEKIDIFLDSSQNIDCGYTLEPPRLCFESKITKIGIPMYTCYIKQK